ncbi:MAG: hypothetical protein IJG51_12825 [Synergistaceae bacterium]|nr:hypothetical protein [Synergistaceae bacterium]MBQ3345882.1 hypothetical protein [Synergistaceae bacterium]MBQ3399766.1 hypothetical protein [Synergistaceae bacterium]MBQ3758857.1 hypothetical protein [Synergistaceae bacterium]MBQ4400860.1 hypothetical protein [Synergistaceae bacterium]
MTLDRILRWVLFCAGIITAIFAGYMFSEGKIDWGAAWLSVSVGFLCFATRVKADKTPSSSSDDDSKELHDMAVLIADTAISSLKNIGRTIPPGTKEIDDLEKKVNDFLDVMPLSQSERENISDEFDRLRNRTRRNEGGRALLRSARL